MLLIILPFVLLGLLVLIFSAGWAMLIFGLAVMISLVSVLLEPTE